MRRSWPWLLNLRDALPRRGEAVGGGRRLLSARRSLPQWRADMFRDRSDWRYARRVGEPTREVVLFADTFNRYFERENLDAALARAGGRRLSRACREAGRRRSSRPLCCGRTFLSVGKVDEARREAERTLAALAPFVARGVPVVGLEPSCLLSFRDEMPAMVKSEAARAARRRRR